MLYTVEVYKADSRTKEGERLVEKEDYDTDFLDVLYRTVNDIWPASKGYRCAIHQTIVERVNMQTGKKFKERYDTPYYCSPSSESYWSA